MEINGIKGEVKFADTINKEKNVTKAKNISINNNYNVSQKISEEQMKILMGVANEQATRVVKIELSKINVDELKEAFSKIPPIFFAANATNENAKIQVNALISPITETSLKKQAISALGMLSAEDISLLNILSIINETAKILATPLSLVDCRVKIDGNIATTDEKIFFLKNNANKINDAITKHEDKFGQIFFTSFTSLRREYIVENNGNAHVNIGEFFCKGFIELMNDMSKNDDFINESFETRARESRAKWTNWFTAEKLPENIKEILEIYKEILDKIPMYSYFIKGGSGLKNYWLISDLGAVILDCQE